VSTIDMDLIDDEEEDMVGNESFHSAPIQQRLIFPAYQPAEFRTQPAQPQQYPAQPQQYPAQPRSEPLRSEGAKPLQQYPAQPQQYPAQPSSKPLELRSDTLLHSTPIELRREGAKPLIQDKDYLYRAFVLYFDNPMFAKVNDASEPYALYYARVKSLLSNPRYLIVITESDYAVKGYKQKLSELAWKSFQLRTINKEIVCPEVSYSKENNGIFDDEIILQQRDKLAEKVIYQCKFNPLTVELLPSKKGSINDYPDKSTLEDAMDSFQCVIYFS